MRATRNLALAAGAMALTLLSAPSASGHAVLERGLETNLGDYGTATVDGEISPGEYGDSCLDVYPAGPVIRLNVCEVNDHVFDYWAVRISAENSPDVADPMGWPRAIYFDDEHDGAIAESHNCYDLYDPEPAPAEDLLGYFSQLYIHGDSTYPTIKEPGWVSGGVEDAFYCRWLGDYGGGEIWYGQDPFDAGQISLQTGVASEQPNATFSTMEFSHPLNWGDADDYSVQPGDTLGWCLVYSVLKEYWVKSDYPFGCFLEPTKYGDIVKESKFHDLVAKAKKLARKVENCDFCALKSRRTLRGEARTIVKKINAENGRGALKRLAHFNQKTRRLIRKGAIGKRAMRLIRIAQLLKREIKVRSKPLPGRPGPDDQVFDPDPSPLEPVAQGEPGPPPPPPPPPPPGTALEADFSCSPSCTVAPRTAVELTSTSAPEAEIVSFEWDLDGDGLYGADDDPGEPTGESASRTFTEPGSFVVGLRVKNDRGEVDTERKEVTVSRR